jgi:hypothetical protein
MNFRNAVKMVKALIAKNAAYQAARPALSEVHGLARAVVISTTGYTGVPADMVADIAEANAHRFIQSYLCV